MEQTEVFGGNVLPVHFLVLASFGIKDELFCPGVIVVHKVEQSFIQIFLTRFQRSAYLYIIFKQLNQEKERNGDLKPVSFN